jgi:hypothetical protein
MVSNIPKNKAENGIIGRWKFGWWVGVGGRARREP